MPKLDHLSDKELAFAKEYVSNGFNGSQAALKTYNCKDPNSAKVVAHAVKKRLTQFNLPGELSEELRGKLSAQSILDRINKIADNPKSPKAVQLNALVQLGKFRDSNLWKESSEVEHSYKPDNQASIDERYRKLLIDKGHSEVPSSSN
jgi:hypothetical protein